MSKSEQTITITGAVASPLRSAQKVLDNQRRLIDDMTTDCAADVSTDGRPGARTIELLSRVLMSEAEQEGLCS